MTLESKWANAPEEKPAPKAQRSPRREKRSENNSAEASESGNSSGRRRRRGGRRHRKHDDLPVREPISFDAFRSKPLNESRSPVRAPINFDRYREKPINGRNTPESAGDNHNNMSHNGSSRGSRGRGGRRRSSASRNDDAKPSITGSRKGSAYNTPPTSNGKPDLQHKAPKSKEPQSPSKIELLKKKIAEQQSILEVNKHKEQQKKLLYDFLNGDDEINWEDDD